MRVACVAAFVSLAVASFSPAAAAPRPPAAPRVIEIQVGDNMKFQPATITASPGESLRVVLKDVGHMPKAVMGHNFVLLDKGANAGDVVQKCASARDSDYITPSAKPQILANTRLVGPGETAGISFGAPNSKGDYQFVCTFPGHYASGMKGTLTVK